MRRRRLLLHIRLSPPGGDLPALLPASEFFQGGPDRARIGQCRAVHRDVQERDGPAKDCRQHHGVVEALCRPAFARAAQSRQMQHAAVVRPQEVGHTPRQVDGRLELVLEIMESFLVRLRRRTSGPRKRFLFWIWRGFT